ncbi:MAG: ABC transporter permease, partial [Acidimicrobiales bacterium]
RAPYAGSPLPGAVGEGMNRTLTIAGLTIREAVRRRLLYAFLVITVTVVCLSAWGFDRLAHSHNITSGEQNLALPQALVLFMFMFSFVIALSASAIASPSVSTEIETGVLMTVVTRPVRRVEVLLGKWLGLAGLLALYTGAVCLLEFVVVDAVSGFLPPNPWLVGVYLFGEGLLLLALSLALSTRLSVIAAGVVGVAVFGAGWLAGVVGSLGYALNISALRTVGSVGRYILPTDGLWRGAIYYLEPSSFLGAGLSRGDPFFVISAPTWGYLLFVVAWLLAVVVIGSWSFSRREL